MHGTKPRLWPSAAASAAVLVAVAAVILTTGCDSETTAWPWWTADDSASVAAELAAWRGVFSANQSLGGVLAGGWRSGLIPQDSASETGDTLYKFAHLLSVRFEPTDSGHRDEYQFGVTADTVVMNDTFCEVAYYDSMAACRAVFEYDSLWVVGFRPETTVIETLVPPETTITLAVSYTELRGFADAQTAEKSYAWTAFRKLFLAKVDTGYELTRATGFGCYTPDAEVAPSLSSTSGVILTKTGRTDTVLYTAAEGGRNLYNLVHVDSLYTIEAGEEVRLDVATTTPADTTADRNLFFLGIAGTKQEITAGARRGSGTFSFTDPGFHHLYVEILPLSSVLYPAADHASTVWAIPVYVRDSR